MIHCLVSHKTSAPSRSLSQSILLQDGHRNSLGTLGSLVTVDLGGPVTAVFVKQVVTAVSIMDGKGSPATAFHSPRGSPLQCDGDARFTVQEASEFVEI